MSDLSLSYYVSISKGNIELLKKFKTLLLDDFKSMDVNFFSAAAENDVAAMRAQLHKIYPLANNLNFFQMLDLIERYRRYHPDDFAQLHSELKVCLTKIYDLLTPD